MINLTKLNDVMNIVSTIEYTENPFSMPQKWFTFWHFAMEHPVLRGKTKDTEWERQNILLI